MYSYMLNHLVRVFMPAEDNVVPIVQRSLFYDMQLAFSSKFACLIPLFSFFFFGGGSIHSVVICQHEHFRYIILLFISSLGKEFFSKEANTEGFFFKRKLQATALTLLLNFLKCYINIDLSHVNANLNFFVEIVYFNLLFILSIIRLQTSFMKY